MSSVDDDDPPSVQAGSKILASMEEEFHDSPDRVLAIVSGAYLDSLIDQLLKAVFVPDDEETEKLIGIYGPLGSNGARCRLAYCLGLISATERDDLANIAKVRNEFAHKYEVASFEHEKVRSLVAKLHYGKTLESFAKEVLKKRTDESGKQTLRAISNDRNKFKETAFFLFAALLRKLDTVARPTLETWYSNAASSGGVRPNSS